MAADVKRPALEEWDENYRNLVKNTILRPKDRQATNWELAFFAEQCIRTGLDPFLRQIYGIFRWDSRSKAEVMTVQVGIDGFRIIAERTGRYEGQTAMQWCGADAQWVDVWLHDDPPKAARVGVFKHGFREPLYAVAVFREFVQTNQQGHRTGQWRDMPAHMIGKCVEALALRKAFPNELSGLYTDDELGTSDIVESTATAHPATAAAEPAALPEGQPPASDTLPIQGLLSDEERAELVQACAERGHEDMTMLLTAVGAESTDELNRGQRDQIIAKLLEVPAREPVEASA